MTRGLPLPTRLLRGFAVDFLTAHAPAAVERIMDPDYRLSIGGHVLDGRDDAYLPATWAQLEQFPGLCITVHDVVLAPDAVAMRFTEHGVSMREGRASSWGGVTLFKIENQRLRHGWAEEDYLGRKRQLKSGRVDAIRAPHPAPWDEPVRLADVATEAVARRWLENPGGMLGSVEEIGAGEPALADLVTPGPIAISMLFSAGGRAAFHGVLDGFYAGGFAEVDQARVGKPITLPIAGIVDIDGGQVIRAQVCGDRLGLFRRLGAAA